MNRPEPNKNMPSPAILLFRGMDAGEIEAACSGLDARTKNYEKGERILFAGDPTDRLGLVVSGSVTIENNDLWGSRTILNLVGKNGFFAETYALLGTEPLSVDVVANEPCEITFFRIRRLMEPAADPPSWASKMLRNLLLVFANKNLGLSRRSFHVSARSMRGRILSYLNTVSLKKHSNEFDIPFDRQQLADYLNVERTALSKELGRMRDEGILSFRKNHFHLIIGGENR